jgi:polyhydroxybutyrate depolymerase
LLLAVATACTAAVHQSPIPTPATASAVSPAPVSATASQGPATAVPASIPTAQPPVRPVPTSPALRVKAGTAACGNDFAPGDSVEYLLTGGNWRSFLLHVPPGYDSTVPTPVVFSFHGYNRSATAQHDYTGLWRVADRAGFILVEPEGWGSPQEWDIAGDYYYDGIDDLTFTTDILQNVDSLLCVDPARIYATGFSNGAEMASLVGCRLGNVFAAIAPVAGVEYDGDCVDRGVPVLSLQGTDDWNVPFDDAPPAMADWAVHNGCGETQSTTGISDSVTKQAYDGCGPADVVLYVVDGGGHTWPGAADDAGDIGGIGFTTHDIDANELIWKFFDAHTLPS